MQGEAIPSQSHLDVQRHNIDRQYSDYTWTKKAFYISFFYLVQVLFRDATCLTVKKYVNVHFLFVCMYGNTAHNDLTRYPNS